MLNSAIYNPRAAATPSQLAAARAKQERLVRIAERARVVTPIVRQPAPEQPAPIIPLPSRRGLRSYSEGMWFCDLVFGAQASLQRILAEPCLPRHPKIETIQSVVADFYEVRRLDILSPRRVATVVHPRQVAMYLAKELTLRSYPDIGRRFGGRDHTTVLHTYRKIGGLILSDEKLLADVNAIKIRIAEGRS